MAENNNYLAKPFIYSSKGLDARHAPDRVPEGYFIQWLNGFERQEDTLSSRYGTMIINRQPPEFGNRNFYFPTFVTSLAKLSLNQVSGGPFELQQIWRYAGLADGTLWRRNGNDQGAYNDVYSGLSGQPFQSLITNCYETSQAYLFIYDANVSIKDSPGFISSPQLTGIDPPDYTANSLPFAPLLTLIDNFAPANSYAASGFSGSWSYGAITSIPANGGQIITDFVQFYNVSGASFLGGTGGGNNVNVTSGTSQPQTTVMSPFGSGVVSSGESVTVTLFIGPQSTAFSGSAVGSGQINYDYSVDGVSWITVKSFSASTNQSYPFQTITFVVLGVTNVDQIQIRVSLLSTFTSGAGSVTTRGNIETNTASINLAGIFGKVCDGILSVLNGNGTIDVPIISASNAFDSNQLYVNTSGSHGLSASSAIGLYGTSNPLLDGYYGVVGVTASNQFFVDLPSTSLYAMNSLSATGGYVVGAANAPSTAVLTDEYSTPYPAQFSAWGFYQQVPTTASNFPIGAFSGSISASNTATVSKTSNFDLSIGNQVTAFDLIVLTINVTNPQNIGNIRLQFDVNGSGYTSAYYYANIAPAFYQGNIANEQSAYQTTQNQILGDALGLITGQPVSSTTAQLQPSNFSTGSGAWAAVYIPRGNFLPVGQAGQSGLDWTNITGWQLLIENNGGGSATVAVNGLYLQWGYGPSSFGGVGYDWRYTYYNANTGTESSPSPEQQFNTQYGYLASLTKPFYFRQAAQVSGQYSSDPQVTHLREYRRGGIYNNNWLLIDQTANVTAGGAFSYKDVVGDASLAQAQPLALDNDPPVTSSLLNPIQTTLAAATTGPGQSIYSTFAPQLIVVTDDTAVFVPTQTVLVGNANNLEEVLVVAGGTGQFTAILRLEHNAGEQISATSVPRQPCNLCALAYGLVWLAGDQNNPHYLYRSKPGYPENFSPADYMPVSSPDDAIMAVINWRGTLVVATLKTWYIVANGATVPQPTGAAHGLVATGGWCLVEGAIFYRAADGWRVFEGADGVYTTLPVEWIFRSSPPNTIVPKADLTQSASDVFCFYNNQIYGSYISASNGQRYRLAFDLQYKRFRLDDVPATAMLWEQDTNALILGKQVGASNYSVVQDWVGDYDDGGWVGTTLIQTPINLATQTPFRDLGRPHNPKQWNVLEGDYDTQGQAIQTTLYFKDEQIFSLGLPAVSTTQRSKVQYQIPPSGASNAQGIEAYSMSIGHTMAVTVAPTLYQENIYAVLLADERTSWDSYWQKPQGDLLALLKDGYFDYTATSQITVQLFCDGNNAEPYYVDNFTLIPQTNRSTVRVQFPARKCRLWRVIATSPTPFHLWSQVRIEHKGLEEGSGYAQMPFEVYQ